MSVTEFEEKVRNKFPNHILTFDIAVFVRGQGKESSTPWPTTEQWNNVIIISTHFNH